MAAHMAIRALMEHKSADCLVAFIDAGARKGSLASSTATGRDIDDALDDAMRSSLYMLCSEDDDSEDHRLSSTPSITMPILRQDLRTPGQSRIESAPDPPDRPQNDLGPTPTSSQIDLNKMTPHRPANHP